MRRRFAVVVFLLAGTAHAAPRIEFEASAVVARSVTPGSSVVIFGAGREPQGYLSQVIRRQSVIRDSDGDGVVRFDLDVDVPYLSMWAVADMSTGEFALASPKDFPLRLFTFDATSLKANGSGKLHKIENHLGVVDILLVRAGTGAWSMTARDGGDEDEDKKNDGKLTSFFEAMRNIGGTQPPPKHVEQGDVLILMDVRKLRVTSVRI